MGGFGPVAAAQIPFRNGIAKRNPTSYGKVHESGLTCASTTTRVIYYNTKAEAAFLLPLQDISLYIFYH
jgi:hypothetical protein